MATAATTLLAVLVFEQNCPSQDSPEWGLFPISDLVLRPLVRLYTAQRKVADLSDCRTGKELEGIWDDGLSEGIDGMICFVFFVMYLVFVGGRKSISVQRRQIPLLIRTESHPCDTTSATGLSLFSHACCSKIQ